MSLSKASAVAGVASLTLVLVVGLSLSADNGLRGILTEGIGRIAAVLADDERIVLREARSLSFFDIEENLRLLIQVFATLAALLAGVLAVISAREETNSLWYSIGVLAGASALVEISLPIAGVFSVVVCYLVMRRKHRRMTPM